MIIDGKLGEPISQSILKPRDMNIFSQLNAMENTDEKFSGYNHEYVKSIRKLGQDSEIRKNSSSNRSLGGIIREPVADEELNLK